MTFRQCALCGLGCGKYALEQRIADAGHVFCCMGCMNVFLILFESGVVASGQNIRETELFKRSLAMGLIAQGDTAERIQPPPEAQPLPDVSTQELLVQVSGMWCTSCAWLIEHVLKKERGVVSARASFASDLVNVTYCPQYVPPQRVLERIQGLGYGAREYSGEQETAEAEKRDLLVRLGLAAFLWANIMSLSLVIYAGYFEPIAVSIRHYLPFLLMALATPVVFYCGRPILKLAWRGLPHGAIRMEALLALGILSAYLYSSVQAIRGGQHFYFDTVSVIVMLVLAGKLIERGAKEKATRWITNLHRLMPNKVRLLSSGVERFVSIQVLEPGMVFLVKAGERIAADGTVAEGSSHADESLLTGESAPVAKNLGDSVVAGSVNLGGVLHVLARRTASDSALAQIIAQVEQALSTRCPVERVVDRVSRIFVPCVIVIAIVTFAALYLLGVGGSTALMRAIAVLVIACPCALGLATPLAISSAMGAASRNGILICDSRVLETLEKLDVIVLDKTGTVTEGRFSVLHHEMLEPRGERVEHVRSAGVPAASIAIAELETRSSELEAIGRVASLEQYSEHPLGNALVKFARQESVTLVDASEIEVHKGQGITGRVGGHTVFTGSRRLVATLSVTSDDAFEKQARRWEDEGKTVAFYGWDNRLRGVLVFGDCLRSDARRLIPELHQRGMEVQLVSGDSEATTRAVARDLSFDSYRAEILPYEKGKIVEQLQRHGNTVAMVGDGINDAPALAQADLGIAMGTGTDLAMKAAAVVLMDGTLEKIPAVLDLSRKTMRVIRQNLFWAFFYNALGIVLAITGVLNPILAAVAMLFSSASVIGNTLRLNRRVQ